MSDAERIAELEYENAWLKAELGLVAERATVVAQDLKLTPQQARLALLLFAAYPRPLNRDVLDARLPNVWHGEDRCAEAIRVLVWQTRQRTGKHFIVTCGHLGYRLSESGRQRIAGVLA